MTITRTGSRGLQRFLTALSMRRANTKDVLEHPEAYHLPAMTDHPIKDVVGVVDGDRLKWREHDFTFHFYPGQTFYHGALWVERADHDPIFHGGRFLRTLGPG